jgi:DNA-binding MarR family transcriptional regulator
LSAGARPPDGERRERPPGGHPYSAEPATDHAELRAALHELVGRFLADYERAALTHGLTLPQARALGFATCEPLSQRALAARFGCDPSNISVLVDRLVERELVERLPDPADGRVKLIAATDAGRELAEACCRDREWLGDALHALEPDECESVHAALTLLLRQ